MNQELKKEIKERVVELNSRFLELSEGMTIELKQALTSDSIGKIKKSINWFKDDWESIPPMGQLIQSCERLRRAYVGLLFRTGFITDEEQRRKLDEVPLALAELIKKYCEILKNKNNEN